MNIARVQRAHGKQGEVVVRPVRGLPLLLAPGLTVALTPPALKRDRFCTVEAVSERADDALVRFSGVKGIADAEAISGCWVLARRADLDLGPLMAPVDDLIGRAVHDERWGDLGQIREVMETPANDVWVVDGSAYGELLIPVIEQVVPGIPEQGAIEVVLLDGIIERDAGGTS